MTHARGRAHGQGHLPQLFQTSAPSPPSSAVSLGEAAQGAAALGQYVQPCECGGLAVSASRCLAFPREPLHLKRGACCLAHRGDAVMATVLGPPQALLLGSSRKFVLEPWPCPPMTSLGKAPENLLPRTLSPSGVVICWPELLCKAGLPPAPWDPRPDLLGHCPRPIGEA